MVFSMGIATPILKWALFPCKDHSPCLGFETLQIYSHSLHCVLWRIRIVKNLYYKHLINTCLYTDCVLFFDLNRLKQIFYRLSICWKSAQDSRCWNSMYDRASTWITVSVYGVWGCDCLSIYFLCYIYVLCFSLLFVLFHLHCNPLSFPLRSISIPLQYISPSSSPLWIVLYWLYPF